MVRVIRKTGNFLKIGEFGKSGSSENRGVRKIGDFRVIGEFRKSASDRGSVGGATI